MDETAGLQSESLNDKYERADEVAAFAEKYFEDKRMPFKRFAVDSNRYAKSSILARSTTCQKMASNISSVKNMVRFILSHLSKVTHVDCSCIESPAKLSNENKKLLIKIVVFDFVSNRVNGLACKVKEIVRGY